ncbi:Pentatricopeptide repeat-containing protein At5g42310 [Durusdinium trenchii]|uniref:Chloroplastic (Protein CRP1 homolog) (AtCRP1) n=1 Tax=Durusdinium trenchii TaxID=1381693 RepID=A0ABP0NRL1_9DINO
MRPAELHQAALALKSQTTSKIKTNERHCLAVTEVDELTSLVADAETGIARQDLDQALAVIAAQCAKGLPAQAESTLEVHAKELAVDGQRPSSAPYGALVQAYAKQGDLEKVQEHLSAMKSLGLSIDMPSYAAAIEAWAKRGGCDAARRILDEAVASGLHPSRGTFTAAVSAYTKEIGQRVDGEGGEGGEGARRQTCTD